VAHATKPNKGRVDVVGPWASNWLSQLHDEQGKMRVLGNTLQSAVSNFWEGDFV
jgi:hypothetical protein